ncbi:sugar/nucleoside kinase (ribokinase family) [Thermocatellispora tengchongensis]|uniref:Sugar/nucleoside kinase (Ribokinase family) n=1 Tax=Thermocatellispora tengchongensis TaxID=1073253 RepID=A0A840PIV8_9ACTN|nr:carbohydrate kinase family protein [Thermocatellispora tengchongensis]MBB5138909.1 sugar/nucleoside kinase (ribokinase family) [Thermocatellispora tengchongensis]
MATSDFDLLVVGDANPDVILSGAPRRPAFGQREELVEAGHLVLGGSGAITAAGAARLGLRTAFAGRVGDDAAGRFVLDALARRGVDVSACVPDPGAPTAITVVLADGPDRAILTAPGALDRLDPADVPPELLRGSRHVHVSSFYLQPKLAAGLPGLFRAARAAGRTTSLDTNDDPAGRWRGLEEVLPVTDLLLPNDREALAIAGRADGDLEAALRDLAARGVTAVVKRGRDGALSLDGDPVAVPAPAATEFADAVGAGDSFNAGLLAARLRGLPLRRCLEVAVACGTLSTRAAGGTAAQPTWEEALSS